MVCHAERQTFVGGAALFEWTERPCTENGLAVEEVTSHTLFESRSDGHDDHDT